MLEMKYAAIDSISRPIARLVMGSMVCSTDKMELTRELLDAYVAAGGNCIDTAHVYAGGKSEQAIGQWFQERNNRKVIILIDKGAHPYWTEPRVNPECIRQDIEESLGRLQTDYIDLYLLHRDDPNYPVGPIVQCLNEAKAAGKIKSFGGSNWTTGRIQEANDFAKEHGMEGFSASSPHFSLAVQNEAMWGGCIQLTTEDYAWHKENQFPLFPWSSQAGGFFTGKFSPDDTSNKDMSRVYYSDENWERRRRARELAEKKDCTANQIALAYVLNQPFPVFALIGPRSVPELEESLFAMTIKLTDDEVRWLSAE